MTVEFNRSWTEADVKALIGQSESIRREFKAGIMFESEPESKWVAGLSKEVSALANTEGGELILGIDEDRKSKPRVATDIDGVPTTLAPERLQQLIEGNVSPYLPGIHFQRVRLAERPDRVVFVIQIPQGSTAYQANDGRYYGRSEFEAKYLPDHEIRLRMSRGKVARAAVHLRLRGVELGAEYEAKIRAIHRPVKAANEAGEANADKIDAILDGMAAQCHPDKIKFDLVLRNDGELTIRDAVVELCEVRSKQFSDGWKFSARPLPPRLEMLDDVIYPGDERDIAGSANELSGKREAALANGDYVVHWKVFLDNSPPSAGAIDLGTEIQRARRESVRGQAAPTLPAPAP